MEQVNTKLSRLWVDFQFLRNLEHKQTYRIKTEFKRSWLQQLSALLKIRKTVFKGKIGVLFNIGHLALKPVLR